MLLLQMRGGGCSGSGRLRWRLLLLLVQMPLQMVRLLVVQMPMQMMMVMRRAVVIMMNMVRRSQQRLLVALLIVQMPMIVDQQMPEIPFRRRQHSITRRQSIAIVAILAMAARPVDIVIVIILITIAADRSDAVHRLLVLIGARRRVI